jgi:hypothetical protein
MKWTGSSPLYVYKKGTQYFYTVDPSDTDYIQNKDNIDVKEWPKVTF